MFLFYSAELSNVVAKVPNTCCSLAPDLFLNLNLIIQMYYFRVHLPKEQKEEDCCSCNLVSIEKTLTHESHNCDIYHTSFSNKVSQENKE